MRYTTILWLFIALCVAALAVTAWFDPHAFVDEGYPRVRTVVIACMLIVLAVCAIRDKNRRGSPEA